MSDKIELAKSSRSTCRQCGEKIQKATLRFGEEYESEYGLSFRWYHLPCAAEKLPALLKSTLASFDGEIPDRGALEAILDGCGGSAEPKEILPDYPDFSLAPTGRAACIQCGEKIEKGSQRISVEVEMEIRGQTRRGAGYMHPGCVGGWLGENDDVDPVEFNRIVAAKSGQAPGTQVAVPEASTKKAVPEIAGKSEKQLRALGKKLMKLQDNYRIGDALVDAVEWKDKDAVLLHLIEHGVVDPGRNIYLALCLEEVVKERGSGADKARLLDIVEQVLSKIPTNIKYKEGPLLPNLPRAAFQLATFLWKNAPERSRALLPVAKANIQAALALAMALDEAELPDGMAETLTKALAPMIGDHPPTFYGAWDQRKFDLDAFVAQLGTTSILADAAVEHLKKDKPTPTTAGLLGAFRIAPANTVLSGLESFLSYNARPSAWTAVREQLSERDDLEQLAKNAASIDQGGEERKKLLIYGVLSEISDELADGLWFSSLSDYDGAFIGEYEAILKKLGEERSLELGRRCLDRDTSIEVRKAWVPLLHRVFGTSALPLLIEAVEKGMTRFVSLAPEASIEAMQTAELEDKARVTAQVSIGVAMAKEGKAVPEALDAAIAQRPRTLAVFAPRLSQERTIAILDAAIESHPPEEVLVALVKAPEAIRRHGIKRFVERRKKIKRTADARHMLRSFPNAAHLIEENIGQVDPGEKKFFGILEKSFSKAVFQALSDAVGRHVESTIEKLERLSSDDGKTTLFFPAQGELEGLRVESFSYSGDNAPASVTAPKGREEDMKHILTLDLSPFPDLVSEFGAETMSLFVEAPNSGEFNDDATLVRSGKIEGIPKGGTPIHLGALKLPAALRESGRKAGQRELKPILFRQTGVVFGPAYWIQQKLGSTVTLQLNDAYMNLGDGGSLYIGDFGTTWQCH